MKVTVQQFKLAFAIFADEMLRTIEDKFRRALAAAKMGVAGQGILKALEEKAVGGMLDVDEIKQYLDNMMRPCDGEIPIPFQFDFLGYKVADPISIVIKQADIDKFFSVTLPSVSAK